MEGVGRRTTVMVVNVLEDLEGVQMGNKGSVDSRIHFICGAEVKVGGTGSSSVEKLLHRPVEVIIRQ
jgi:hypothetical protein